MMRLVRIDDQRGVSSARNELVETREQRIEHRIERRGVENQAIDRSEGAQRRELVIELPSHAVQGGAERAELVAWVDLHGLFEVVCGDALRAFEQLVERVQRTADLRGCENDDQGKRKQRG